MALVKNLTNRLLERESTHLDAECTYTITTDAAGRKFLQLDTYGSKAREFAGKKSQSIKLSPEAIDQLKEILSQNGL